MRVPNYGRRGLHLVAALFLALGFPCLGEDGRRDGADQIQALLKHLSEHSAKPQNVLDPQLSDRERKRNLDYFSDAAYEFSVTPIGEISIQAKGRAVLPVRLLFTTRTRDLHATTRLNFVERGGVWYFATFDFLKVPPLFIALMVIEVILFVAYGAVILVLKEGLEKKGKLRAINLVKLFIPLCWPALFSESRLPTKL